MHDFQERCQTVFRATVCQKRYPEKVFFFVVNKKKFSPKGLESLIKGLYVSHLDCNPREIVKRFNDSFLIKRTLVKGYNPLTFSAF